METSGYIDRLKFIKRKKAFTSVVITDFLLMSLLFLSSVFFVYYLQTLRDYFFILLLFFYLLTRKNNYFWFAFFFILINSPAYFFQYSSLDAPFRLPLYVLLPGFSFTIFDLFLIISILKSIKKASKKSFYFSKPWRYLLIYLMVITIPITFIIGMDLDRFMFFLRPYAFYLLIIPFVILIRNTEDLIKFGYLLAPFCILIFLDQILTITTGEHIPTLITSESSNRTIMNVMTGEIRPVVGGVFILFYTILFSFQTINNPKYQISRNLSYLFLILPLFSVVLSATRSWIVIFLFSLIVYSVYSSKRLLSSRRFIFAGVVIFIIIINIISVRYITGSIKRFEPVLSTIINFDISQATVGNDRFENDIPMVLSGISRNPLLGVGMSRYYFYRNDVGFLNTILTVGILGFLILIYILARTIRLLNKLRVRLKQENNIYYYSLVTSILVIFISILPGYFTTQDFFGFYSYKIFFISILFGSADVIMNELITSPTGSVSTKVK